MKIYRAVMATATIAICVASIYASIQIAQPALAFGICSVLIGAMILS